MATIQWWKLALWASLGVQACGFLAAQQQPTHLPNRIAQRNLQRSRNFLSRRSSNRQNVAAQLAHARQQDQQMQPSSSSQTASWTPIGPSAVQTSTYGLISGRVTSIAVDPSDASGNTIYVGTTGGGVWKSTNAAGTSGTIAFTPRTDTLPVPSDCSTPPTPSLSIGAITVQPGGTGVILAGTGDPNDATDSYYGMGILRSIDGGNTWCMISDAVDDVIRKYTFTGEGFSGFAWSTTSPQFVVAAVADSLEGRAVDAPNDSSFAGIYYSDNAGLTWHLATISDGPGATFQSPLSSASGNPGSAATSVTWNPIRKRFYAAVRFHGYYESTDGVNWTRLDNQPGVNLFPAKCPANPNQSSSSACPIFRGTIVSQPVTGDLFAITVDGNNIDQGLWRDVCSANASGCSSSTVTFAQRIADAAIATGSNGTIPQGDYDLSLAAVPAQQDTLLFVGTQDLFRCSLLNNCVWRNTTNSNGCAAAQVAPSQHAVDATFGASGLMYFGNDGGLWRTTDAVNQQQATCSQDDAVHFQNLNGGLGSIAEVGAFSVDPHDATTLMAAMGAFGTAAPSRGSAAWAQILDGEGDSNAIDPENPQNWYATSATPVSINLCTNGALCDKAGFGLSPVINSASVGNDGDGLSGAAAWILDPQNTANMIIGTCRVWRGPANGQGWVSSDAISSSLDKDTINGNCVGHAQIRSLAASGGTGTTEKIYAGMAGAVDGGMTVAGHIYSATVSAAMGSIPVWTDLSNTPTSSFHSNGFDVSSIYVDPHDATGNTVYVTLQGFLNFGDSGALVYRSLDGGASWIVIASNLPDAPANSILVDPNDANTVYVAMDTGVYVTRNINLCQDSNNDCWVHLGAGLPYAPVTQLKFVNYGNTQALLASTYGRGLWQIPLVTAGTVAVTATVTPSTLTFAGQPKGTISTSQTVTVKNTGTFSLNISSIISGENFLETDNCTQQPILPGSTCSIQVSFAPEQTGTIQDTLTVYGNLPGGQITEALSGMGLNPGNLALEPLSLNFGDAVVGATTAAQNITISNTGGVNVNLRSPSTTGDFKISADTCGASIAPNYGCTVSVIFTPTAAGGRVGVFSISNDEGTQIAQLSGNGQMPATAAIAPTSLGFSPVTIGYRSDTQTVTLSNNGDLSLKQINVSVSPGFSYASNCGGLLAGHSNCAILVAYVPTQVGEETGTLVVSTELGSQSVALKGTGLAPPGISIEPKSVDFGGQGVNTTSDPTAHTLTLSNNASNGGFPLTGLTFAVTGDFAIASNGCNSMLSPQNNCKLQVTFTPAQTRSRIGTLTVGASNLSTPFVVPLSGTGEDFQITVTGPTSAVIVSGQTATYNVQVTSVDGSNGPISIGCSGAPQNTVCTANPATGATLSSGGTVSATVTVSTGVSSTSSFTLRNKARLAFAVLLPWVFWGFRKQTNRLRCWLICLISIALLASVACGTNASGGSGSTGPGGGDTPPGITTPSGLYTLNITASMDGLKKNVPVTLTVQ